MDGTSTEMRDKVFNIGLLSWFDKEKMIQQLASHSQIVYYTWQSGCYASSVDSMSMQRRKYNSHWWLCCLPCHWLGTIRDVAPPSHPHTRHKIHSSFSDYIQSLKLWMQYIKKWRNQRRLLNYVALNLNYYYHWIMTIAWFIY